MATQVVNTTFKLKRGIASRWVEVNPILMEGEPGFEIDTNRLKVGNGTTPWNDLPYIEGKREVDVYTSRSEFPPVGDVTVLYADGYNIYRYIPEAQDYVQLSSAIQHIAVNGVILEPEDNTVAISVPTKFTELEDSQSILLDIAGARSVAEQGLVLATANAAAINILNSDVTTVGSVKFEAKSAADLAIATILDSAPEVMDTLREVAEWVENHEGDVTTLIGRIDAHEEAIDLINDPVLGILAQAIAYTDTMTGNLPAATVETLGLIKIDGDTVKLNEDNQIYIARVSTDMLQQGSDELVLNGGDSSIE